MLTKNLSHTLLAIHINLKIDREIFAKTLFIFEKT